VVIVNNQLPFKQTLNKVGEVLDQYRCQPGGKAYECRQYHYELLQRKVFGSPNQKPCK